MRKKPCEKPQVLLALPLFLVRVWHVYRGYTGNVAAVVCKHHRNVARQGAFNASLSGRAQWIYLSVHFLWTQEQLTKVTAEPARNGLFECCFSEKRTTFLHLIWIETPLSSLISVFAFEFLIPKKPLLVPLCVFGSAAAMDRVRSAFNSMVNVRYLWLT